MKPILQPNYFLCLINQTSDVNAGDGPDNTIFNLDRYQRVSDEQLSDIAASKPTENIGTPTTITLQDTSYNVFSNFNPAKQDVNWPYHNF